MVVLNASLAFSLLLLLPSRGNCLSFLFINQKMKVDPGCFFSPHFFLHFFHTEERVMNELCLCEVAEIHFIVSNIDFCAGRSLMSLHVLDVVCVCFYVCMLYPDCACESISLSKLVHISVFSGACHV